MVRQQERSFLNGMGMDTTFFVHQWFGEVLRAVLIAYSSYFQIPLGQQKPMLTSGPLLIYFSPWRRNVLSDCGIHHWSMVFSVG